MVKVLGRAILGLVLGKSGPGMLNNTDSYKSIPIGFHTVVKERTIGAGKKNN
jgi:hypothetical protein